MTAEAIQWCPGCHIAILKSGGCDDMRCTMCDTRFCYRCGMKLEYGRHINNQGVCPKGTHGNVREAEESAIGQVRRAYPWMAVNKLRVSNSTN
ncbi:hypothetical protein BDQ17DRAFT_1358404 [Cyathus striatus]|nr:hypothetical protein BDQ17DRAFT_1358404 [Cyathus striatus]